MEGGKSDIIFSSSLSCRPYSPHQPNLLGFIVLIFQHLKHSKITKEGFFEIPMESYIYLYSLKSDIANHLYKLHWTEGNINCRMNWQRIHSAVPIWCNLSFVILIYWLLSFHCSGDPIWKKTRTWETLYCIKLQLPKLGRSIGCLELHKSPEFLLMQHLHLHPSLKEKIFLWNVVPLFWNSLPAGFRKGCEQFCKVYQITCQLLNKSFRKSGYSNNSPPLINNWDITSKLPI